MHLAIFIIIGILAVGVVAAIISHFGWSISTQHRDHDVATAGPLPRRRIFARRRSPGHAGPVNSEAIPGDSISGPVTDRSAGITGQ